MMSTRRHVIWLAIAAIGFAGPVTVQAQVAMGTAFTYQGQLQYDGLPVNDTADLRIVLWDNATSPPGVLQPSTDHPPALVDLHTAVLVLPGRQQLPVRGHADQPAQHFNVSIRAGQ